MVPWAAFYGQIPRNPPRSTATGFGTLNRQAGGAILDLGCHCVEIARSWTLAKDIRPVEVMCWADTAKPIDAEDHAIGLVKYENGAIGQFEAVLDVSRRT